MTREEIYDNIEYNENLITEYRRAILSLQDKISGLRSQIKGLNSQISNCISDRKSLNSQIDELEQLKKKYKKLQSDFSQRQLARVRELSANFSHKSGFKFMTAYADGMSNLLSGSEYKSTYNGLTTAVNIISKKINSIQKNLDNVNKRIKGLQRQIDSNEGEIQRAESKISQNNEELSYRRQRVIYWQNQLQFAVD